MNTHCQLLSRLAVAMLGHTSTQVMLDRAVRHAVVALRVEGASVVLAPTVAAPQYLAASDPAALHLARLQLSLDQAPCTTAQADATRVSIPDLSVGEGFTVFRRAAGPLGRCAVFSFPLLHGEETLGALDLHRAASGMLGDDEVLTAQTLADLLAAYIVSAQSRAALEATTSRALRAAARQRALHEDSQDFVAGLVHELGNPIASIAGFSEMLQDGPDDLSLRQRHCAAAIHRGSERLRSLASELLTLFRVDRATVHPDHTRVDLRAVVTAAGAGLELAATAAAIHVSVHLPDSPVVVNGHPRHLERMLSNLLSNAVKYTLDGGSVVCVLDQQDGHATLEVRDTGIGIPETEQEELYTRFFRASTATDRGIEGTGLGLAIVQSVVRDHRGTIAVSSEVDQGTRFLVRLPVAPGPGARGAPEQPVRTPS